MGSEFDDVLITNWRSGSIRIVVGETRVVDGRRRAVLEIYDADKDSPSKETFFNGDQLNLTLSEKKKEGVFTLLS